MKDVILAINDRCAAVQTIIAQSFENPDNPELRAQIQKLRELLDSFLKLDPPPV